MINEDKANDPKFERIGYKDQVLDIINSLELPSETDKHILKSRFLYLKKSWGIPVKYTPWGTPHGGTHPWGIPTGYTQ